MIKTYAKILENVNPFQFIPSSGQSMNFLLNWNWSFVHKIATHTQIAVILTNNDQRIICNTFIWSKSVRCSRFLNEKSNKFEQAEIMVGYLYSIFICYDRKFYAFCNSNCRTNKENLRAKNVHNNTHILIWIYGKTERASETRAERVCVNFKTKRSTAALRCIQPLSVKREMKERNNNAPRVRRLCELNSTVLCSRYCFSSMLLCFSHCVMWKAFRPNNTRLMMMMLLLFRYGWMLYGVSIAWMFDAPFFHVLCYIISRIVSDI